MKELMDKKAWLVWLVMLAIGLLLALFIWSISERPKLEGAQPITFQAVIPNTVSALPKRRVTDEAQDITFRVPKTDAEKVEVFRDMAKRNVVVKVTVE